jgi:5,10-methylenetetrahydrofolate reductase
MNSFRERLSTGVTVITVEVTPPRGTDFEEVIERVVKLKGVADAIDVTSCPMAKLHMNSTIFGYLLKEQLDVEVIVNTTTRDKNILGIQSELLGAHALGIRNLAVIRGDRMNIGDFPTAKEVFEVDAVGLLKIIKNLNSGMDALGRQIKGATDFFVGAVINPNSKLPKEKVLRRIRNRADERVGFFLTQPIYSLDAIRSFGQLAAEVGIPVILGILPLKNKAMAHKVAHELPGVEVPRAYLEVIDRMRDEYIKQYSLDYSLKIMNDVKSEFAGFHIMTAGDLAYAKALIEAFRG